jgi:curved DNA-binding protein CbpA
MTDYFALLDQPRRPWLDPEQVKAAFHRKTLAAHPDASAAGNAETSDKAFALVNEARDVLQNPKRRIQHLLALAGYEPASRFDAIPNDVAELFPAVATLTQDADNVLQKMMHATSTLARSVAKAELLQTRSRLEEMLATLTRLQAAAEDELKKIDDRSLTAVNQPANAPLSFRAERSAVEESRGATLKLLPRDPSASLGLTDEHRQLHALFVRFSYLQRWTEQLHEKRTQLDSL